MKTNNVKDKEIGKTIIKILLFFLSWAILSGLIEIPIDNPALWRLSVEILPFIIIVVFSVVFWLIDKRTFPIISWKGVVPASIIGFVCGFLWLGIPTIILYLLGVVEFESTNDIENLILWILACICNVIMQELLVRGYIYQHLKSKYNVISAVIVSTAIFTLLHGGAFEEGIIPVLCVFTMSLLMSVILEYTQSLIAPIIMHALWNCIGAIILNLILLSDDYPHVINAVITGNNLISGGSCLIEGSVVVLSVNIIMIAVFYGLLRKYKKD